MSGQLTPPEPTPLDRTQRVLLPVADFFMILMWSRPPGGSLRTARVTPVTIGLAVAVTAVGAVATVGLLAQSLARPALLPLAGCLLAAALSCGSGVLAVFGIRQRRLMQKQKSPAR